MSKTKLYVCKAHPDVLVCKDDPDIRYLQPLSHITVKGGYCAKCGRHLKLSECQEVDRIPRRRG